MSSASDISPSVAIITCTIGRAELTDALETVNKQTHKNVTHYIVADGCISHAEYLALRAENEAPHRRFMYWPTKVGGENWECRRLWSALAPLINEECATFLNDDDWWQPAHLESLLHFINHGFDWSYSFRAIFNKDREFLCNDECESLGEAHPVWNRPWENFAEGGSVLMRTHCYRAVAPYFCQQGWGNDRLIYNHLKRLYPKFAGTGQHTMCFRLGGNAYSANLAFFEQGNLAMKAAYPNGMPWKVVK